MYGELIGYPKDLEDAKRMIAERGCGILLGQVVQPVRVQPADAE